MHATFPCSPGSRPPTELGWATPVTYPQPSPRTPPGADRDGMTDQGSHFSRTSQAARSGPPWPRFIRPTLDLWSGGPEIKIRCGRPLSTTRVRRQTDARPTSSSTCWMPIAEGLEARSAWRCPGDRPAQRRLREPQVMRLAKARACSPMASARSPLCRGSQSELAAGRLDRPSLASSA